MVVGSMMELLGWGKMGFWGCEGGLGPVEINFSQGLFSSGVVGFRYS